MKSARLVSGGSSERGRFGRLGDQSGLRQPVATDLLLLAMTHRHGADYRRAIEAVRVAVALMLLLSVVAGCFGQTQPTPQVIYVTPPPTPQIIYVTPPPTPQIIYVTPPPTPTQVPTTVPTVAPTLAPTLSPSVGPVGSPLLYKIKSGDSLAKIANKYHVTVQQILDANPAISDPNHMEVGEVIVIPQAPILTPTSSPSPTKTPAPTATAKPQSAFDLMPNRCRDASAATKLRAKLDADSQQDAVWFGYCSPGTFGPVTWLSANDEYLSPSPDSIVRGDGYGWPFEVVAWRTGQGPVMGVVRLMGASGETANLSIYVVDAANAVARLVWASDTSVYQGYWEWCDFKRFSGSSGQLGFIVTETDSYGVDACQTGPIHSTAYVWQVNALPANGAWPEPEQTASP